MATTLEPFRRFAALRGCHSQAKTLDALMKRVREAVQLCLESEDDTGSSLELVGVQQISI